MYLRELWTNEKSVAGRKTDINKKCFCSNENPKNPEDLMDFRSDGCSQLLLKTVDRVFWKT